MHTVDLLTDPLANGWAEVMAIAMSEALLIARFLVRRDDLTKPRANQACASTGNNRHNTPVARWSLI